MSEVGFEPTPTLEDQNTQTTFVEDKLQSGAYDHSAILTLNSCIFFLYIGNRT